MCIDIHCGNLLFLLLFVQLVYVAIRWYIKGWRDTRSYY
ncbi:DUF6040 family protein [Dorea longicatena]|nr:DUF6040 family protein [bacterium MSK17_88]MCB5547668.1 DUF6040 family protein [Dorea longicatena]MCB6955376.1 DUF6040 family protein [Dorea longicatena]